LNGNEQLVLTFANFFFLFFLLSSRSMDCSWLSAHKIFYALKGSNNVKHFLSKGT
jgi:competence transcription factor ComK